MATFSDLVISNWQARYRGQIFPCAIGRGGIDTKSGEGDGVTPRGTWRITQILTRPDRCDLNATPIRPHMYWSDDPLSPNYNTCFHTQKPAESAERLWRADPLYDLVAVLNYNRSPIIPGKGSAIFLHSWRKPRHPTEGCIAFAAPTLRHILTTWSHSARIVIK